MICDACGEYNYTGTKFTSKVEQIKHESYLGLKVYRFYGRCRHCWAEFTFKTDPKNSDYTMESGGKRTYEAWKDADMMEAQLKKEKEDEKADQMKALEQKSIDVAAEMQRLEDLDAIRTMNKRLGARDQSIEGALEYLFKRDSKIEEEKERLSPGEDEELAGFREAQEENKRRKLDEEVEGTAELPLPFGVVPSAGSSSSSGSSGSGSGAGSNTSVCTALSSSAPSASATPCAAAIASAVAERVANSTSTGRATVGARFTVVRKKDGAGMDSSTLPLRSASDEIKLGAHADASTGGSTQTVDAMQNNASGVIGGGVSGGLAGLGAYDSDESSP